MSNSKNKDNSIVSIIPLEPSNFETIDFAVFDFVNEKMNVSCNTNKGWKKVPVIWAGAERAYQVKNNPDLRDIEESVIFPIISIIKESPKKSIESKGKFYANIPANNDFKGGSIVIAKRIKQDKTQNFANAESYRLVSNGGNNQINFPGRKNKVVYEIASMPQPVYFEIPYTLNIKTEYQEQMNDILQPFIVKPGSVNRVMLEKNGYKYEAFIQPDFKTSNNSKQMTSENRIFETEINIKVFGYVLAGNSNEEKPFITIRESIVEIKIQREKVITGDIPGYTLNGKFIS